MTAACTVPGCDRPAHGNGMCKRHYQRAWRLARDGNPNALLCGVEGCQRPADSRGLCGPCYQRHRYHATKTRPHPDVALPVLPGALCATTPGDWVPVSESSRAAAAAVEVCQGCPVRVECLEFALAAGVQGIWGATTTLERSAMRQKAGVR